MRTSKNKICRNSGNFRSITEKKIISGKGPYQEPSCKKIRRSDENCKSLSIFSNFVKVKSFKEQNVPEFRQFPVDQQKKIVSGKGPHRERLCKKLRRSDENCRSLSIFSDFIKVEKFKEQNVPEFRQFPVDQQKKIVSGKGPYRERSCKKLKRSSENCRSLSIFSDFIKVRTSKNKMCRNSGNFRSINKKR